MTALQKEHVKEVEDAHGLTELLVRQYFIPCVVIFFDTTAILTRTLGDVNSYPGSFGVK